MNKPAARSGWKSALKRGIECGLIPKAKKPFQIFLARQKLQVGPAAKIWKGMSKEEKLPYASANVREQLDCAFAVDARRADRICQSRRKENSMAF